MEKYSIIVPCYNLEDIIAKTIRSILNQKYKNFELIIIDDGSDDNTLEIIEEYAHNDTRIKTYTKPNGGVSSARNLGIDKSCGDYILFLDGDDFISEDLLSKAHEIFSNKNIDMFSFGYHLIDGESDKTLKKYVYTKYDKTIFSGEQFQSLCFSKKIYQSMCSFIIKSDVIKRNNIYFDENTYYGEDQEFQLRCNLMCEKIYYGSEAYFFYSQRSGSAMNQPYRRENHDVFDRMSLYLNGELISTYYNYLCYVFVADIKSVMKHGSDTETIKKLLERDTVFSNFTLQINKYSILTSLFIIIYKLFYKKYLKYKYRIYY